MMDVGVEKVCAQYADLQKKLYEKSLNFNLKESSSSLSSNTVRLCLSIEWQTSTNGLHNKELLITLTDALDPFFLYTLHLGGEDFLNLKQQQGLLVDFLAFPQSFINLLEQCLQEESKVEPKYLLYLSICKVGAGAGTAQLDIVETNQFKLLTHLSLKLATPTDFMVKQYLTTCFRNLKEEKERLENRACFLEQELKKQVDRVKETLSDKSKSCHALELEREAEISSITQKFEHQLKMEKQKAADLLNGEYRKWKEEMSEMDYNHKRSIKNYELKVSNLEKVNKEFREKIDKLGHSEGELRCRVKSLDKDLKGTQSSLDSYKKQSNELELELKEAKPELELLRSAKISMEKQIASQNEVTLQMEDDLKRVLKEKDSLEMYLKKTKDELEQTERNERCLAKDIAKANDIIRKMQGEARIFNEKLKSRGKLALKLEEVLQEKESIIRTLEEEVSSTKLLLKNQKDEINELMDTVRKLQKKLTETERKLQGKEEILKFIDHQFCSGSESSQKPSSSSNTVPQEGAGAHNLNATNDIHNEENVVPSTGPTIACQNNHKQSVLTDHSAMGNSHIQCSQSLHPRYLEKHPNFFISKLQTQQPEEEEEDYIQEIYRTAPTVLNQASAHLMSTNNIKHLPNNNWP